MLQKIGTTSNCAVSSTGVDRFSDCQTPCHDKYRAVDKHNVHVTPCKCHVS